MVSLHFGFSPVSVGAVFKVGGYKKMNYRGGKLADRHWQQGARIQVERPALEITT